MENKTNSNFFRNILKVILIPVILGVGFSLISSSLGNFDFYLENSIIISLVSLIVTILIFAYSGRIAVKEKEYQIKPWMAGFFTGLLISITSILIEQIAATNPIPLETMTIVFYLIPIVFSALFGSLFAVIGGKIAQD